MDQSPPWAASLADRYEVERELAEGGMATVYLARDTRHGRDVALKLLKPEVGSAVGSERFLREIQTIAKLQHPHILPLYDSGEIDGHLYFAMPFVEGESLRDRLDRDGPMRFDEVLDLAHDIGDALEFAHERQVVHRDIKPGNVMLYRGHATVTDFGIARALEAGESDLTEAGLAIGTPHYMSPEQIASDASLDARSDQYSLGCVIYEMLVGEPPFQGRTAQAVFARHLTDAVPSVRTVRTQLPAGIDDVLARALAKSPADRFASISDFLDALENPAPPAAPGRRKRKVRAISGLAAVAITAVGAGLLVQRFATTVSAPADESTAIAVLPFANSSGDPGNDYLSAGVSEDLIATLARVPGLRVASRVAASGFRDETDLRAVADALDVGYLVTGSVGVAGDQMRLLVELIDPSTMSTVWAENYRPSRSDVAGILDVQEAIARHVSDSLALRLSGAALPPVTRSYTESPVARDLYWRGRYHWNLRDAASVQAALGLFQQSIQADPEYPLPYSGVADVFVQLGSYSVQPPRNVYPAARQAAETALALAEDVAAAHNSLGLITLFYDWDPARAGQHFDRALALDPDYTLAHMGRSMQLMAEGRDEEAVSAARRATEVDPFSVTARENVGRILYQVGRFDEAVSTLRETVGMDRRSIRARSYLGMALLELEEFDEALEELEAVDELAGGIHLSRASLGVAYARVGRRDAAEEIVASLEEEARVQYVPAFKIGVVHAALGQLDQAFFRFDEAIRERESFMIQFADDPFIFDLHQDPRFSDIVSRVTPVDGTDVR